MATRVGINGFGRIGRNVYRAMRSRDDMEIVAVNDLSDAKTLALLLKYDSVHGVLDAEVKAKDGALVVAGKECKVLSEKDPSKLPWKEMNVDMVVESTGVFRKRDQVAMHLDAGAKKVVLTVPSKDEIDATIVLGVNTDALKPEHKIISNASCTTNCIAPMAKVLHETFGIARGFMTTIHAYTNDQSILDLVHKDPRRARAAGMNIIPTTTGAAVAVGKVIPELNGKMDGIAMRVPVPDGSITDFVAQLEKKATVEDVNNAMKRAAAEDLKDIMQYTDEPIVSSDVIGNPYSCIFDSLMTRVIGENFVKVIGWYDNEWAYSKRVVELIALAASM